MAAIFSSLHRTIIAGFVLLVLIAVVVGILTGQGIRPDHAWFTFVMRWLHVLSGMMWVGLLYYFNFVQTPSMPRIPDAQKPAVSKVIAPLALFWFRWAALATVVTGLLLAGMSTTAENNYIVRALTLQKGQHAIGIGMWLAMVMAFNVWFVIWPNQQKALGLIEATAEEKTRAARIAGLTSRINTMLSIPMLYCMVAQQNQGL